MRTAYFISEQKMSTRTSRFSATRGAAKPRSSRQSKAGVTLVETVVSLMIILIGLGGLFGTSARSFTLLRRSKEVVAIRECLLTRLDGIRALSFAEVARPAPPTSTTTSTSTATTQTGSLSTNLLLAGTAGDPTPFGVTLSGVKNLKETVTVYALGAQLFSNDAQRNNATPDYADEIASQFDDPAPAPPTTYKANSTTKGDWTKQVAGALHYYQITRTGSGAAATITIDKGTSNGDLSDAPLLRVDVAFTWQDSNKITRTQVGSTLVSRNGSLQ